MASGWDPGTKSVIRFNSRNHGPTIWEEDAIAAQAIDPEGHDVNDQTLADSITETLNINGINNMLADLNLGGFKAVGMAAGVAATDGANLAQVAAAVASGIAAAGGGIRWTQVEVSTTLALGNRFAALSFGSTIVWTLPAISGALPLSGPNDIWIFNGDANNDIQLDPLAGIGGRIYWNGQDLGLSTNILIQPGQMAIIVPVGASEANAWNVHTTNSGDRTPYGVAWDGSNRPPSQHEVYQQLVSAFNQIAAKVPNTGNTTIAGIKTFTSHPVIPDEAYGVAWDGKLQPPTKNALYDYLSALIVPAVLWTPVVWDFDQSNGKGQTYTLQASRVTKIGDMVFFSGTVNLSSKGTLTGGFVYIGQLPYTAAAANLQSGIIIGNATNLSLGTACAVVGRVVPGSTRITLLKFDATGGMTNLDMSNLTNGSALSISGFYFTD